MEEKDRKFSPVLITIILLLGLFLIGFTIWYVLNYSNIKEPVITPEEQSKIEQIEKENKITTEQAQAYSSLITIDGSYGFYFDKSVSIDDISDFNMISYILNNYVKENKVSMDGDLQCLIEPYEECSGVEFPSISNEKLNNNIKTKFNTSRFFEITQNNVPDQFIDSEEYIVSDVYNGYFLYDFSKKTYSFGYLPTGGMFRKIHTKLSKVEEEEDKLYFYDKAFVEEEGEGYISLMAYLSSDSSANNNEFFSYDIEKNKKVDEIKITNKDGTNYYEANIDYIFDKYSDKLNTYKHTFKKINNNYYWVSSEIVK